MKIRLRYFCSLTVLFLQISISNAQFSLLFTEYINLHKYQYTFSLCNRFESAFNLEKAVNIADSLSQQDTSIFNQLPKAYLNYKIWGVQKSFSFIESLKLDDYSLELYMKCFVLNSSTSKQNFNDENIRDLHKKLHLELKSKFDGSLGFVLYKIDDLRGIISSSTNDDLAQIDKLLLVQFSPDIHSYLLLAKAEILYKLDEKETAETYLDSVIANFPNELNHFNLYVKSKYVAKENPILSDRLKSIALQNMMYTPSSINKIVKDLKEVLPEPRFRDSSLILIDKIINSPNLSVESKICVAQLIYIYNLDKQISKEKIESLVDSKMLTTIVKCHQKNMLPLDPNGQMSSYILNPYKVKEDAVARMLPLDSLEIQNYSLMIKIYGDIIQRAFSEIQENIELQRSESYEFVENNEELEVLLLKNPYQDYKFFHVLYRYDGGTIDVIENVLEKYPGIDYLRNVKNYIENNPKD